MTSDDDDSDDDDSDDELTKTLGMSRVIPTECNP